MGKISALDNKERLLFKLLESTAAARELARDVKRAEGMTPLTRAQAEAMPLAELAGRAKALLAHWKLALINEHDFIVSFRVELNVLRRRCRQQGRQIVREGSPSWGEIKKAFRMSGRQIDRLLQEPGARPARKALPPVPFVVVPRGDAVALAAALRVAAGTADGRLDEALVAELVAGLDGEWRQALLRALGGQGAGATAVCGPAPAALGAATPEAVAGVLNGAYREKPGRHEAVRQMLKLLDKCVLWEISYASSEERSNRLNSLDNSARHVFPSEAAQEVLKRGGFWSAKALIAEADIHVTWDSVPNGCGVSLDHFKQHVLGWLRLTGKLKTRMLGRVCWYCHPDHEAALKAAKKAEGPEFHCAEGELPGKPQADKAGAKAEEAA
jgi:hypothetical protein